MTKPIYLCNFQIKKYKRSGRTMAFIEEFEVKNIVAKGNTIEEIKNSARSSIEKEASAVSKLKRNEEFAVGKVEICKYLSEGVAS